MCSERLERQDWDNQRDVMDLCRRMSGATQRHLEVRRLSHEIEARAPFACIAETLK